MKPLSKISLFLAFFVNNLTFCQSISNETAEKLSVLATEFEKGIHERMIPLGYVSSPNFYSKKESYTPRNENTYNYMRFVFDKKFSDEKNYIVGKVFISERYLEKEYREKFTSDSVYKYNTDGFFNYCKLFYDPFNKDFRINIYPEIYTEICLKKMHGNKHICINTNIHDKTCFSIIAYDDFNYDDFLRLHVSDYNKNSRFFTLKDLNINKKIKKRFKLNTVLIEKESFLKKEKHDVIRRLNLEKTIKTFSIEIDTTNKPKKFTLQNSKYSLSEDLIPSEHYFYLFKSYDELKSIFETIQNKTKPFDNKKKHAFLLTENKWYETVRVSEVPDDIFIDNFDRFIDPEITWLSFGKKGLKLLDQKEILLSAMSKKEKDLKAVSDSLEKNKTEATKIQQSFDSTNTNNVEKKLRLEKLDSKYKELNTNIIQHSKSLSSSKKAMEKLIDIQSQLKIKNDSILILQDDSLGLVKKNQLKDSKSKILKTNNLSSENDLDVKKKETEQNISSLDSKKKELNNKMEEIRQQIKSLDEELAKTLKIQTQLTEQKGQISSSMIDLKEKSDKVKTDIDSHVSILNQSKDTNTIWIYYKMLKGVELNFIDKKKIQKEIWQKPFFARDTIPIQQIDANNFLRGNITFIYEPPQNLKGVPKILAYIQQGLSKNIKKVVCKQKVAEKKLAISNFVPDKIEPIEKDGFTYYWLKLKRKQ